MSDVIGPDRRWRPLGAAQQKSSKLGGGNTVTIILAPWPLRLASLLWSIVRERQQLS